MSKTNWKACGKFPGKMENFQKTGKFSNITETEYIHWKLEGMWKVSR